MHVISIVALDTSHFFMVVVLVFLVYMFHFVLVFLANSFQILFLAFLPPTSLIFLFFTFQCDTSTINKYRRHMPFEEEGSMYSCWDMDDWEGSFGRWDFQCNIIQWFVFDFIFSSRIFFLLILIARESAEVIRQYCKISTWL